MARGRRTTPPPSRDHFTEHVEQVTSRLAARRPINPDPLKIVEAQPPRIDGRTLRKTNRVVPLSLSVTPEFDQLLRTTAQREGILLAEVLERGLALYTQKPEPLTVHPASPLAKLLNPKKPQRTK